MVQISKINNQNLSFSSAKKVAQNVSKITCQYMSLPGNLDCVRILERFPNGTRRTAVVSSDYFAKQISQKGKKGINSFFQWLDNLPSKDISNSIL